MTSPFIVVASLPLAALTDCPPHSPHTQQILRINVTVGLSATHFPFTGYYLNGWRYQKVHCKLYAWIPDALSSIRLRLWYWASKFWMSFVVFLCFGAFYVFNRWLTVKKWQEMRGEGLLHATKVPGLDINWGHCGLWSPLGHQDDH